MKLVSSWPQFLTIASFVLVTGCGGGGDASSSGETQAQSASPGGIWQGTDGNGLQITGIVTETGDAYFLDSNGTQYFGTVSTSGNNLTGSFTGYTEFGDTFTDGSTSGTGSLTGTVDARTSMSFSTTFTTAGGSTNQDNFALQYNQIYAQSSSLSTVAGTYTDASTGNVLNIASDGSVSLQVTSTGCAVTGDATIINSQYNAYSVQFTYSGCQGGYSALNGVQFNGLATLNTSVSPEQLIVGADAKTSTGGISLINTFNRN